VRWRLDRFAEAFDGRGMHEITAGDIENFLGQYKGWSRRSFFKRLRPFFAYGIRHRMVAENPMSFLTPPDVPSAKKTVYTARQLATLLHRADESHPDMLASIALSAFGFLRTAEMIRLYSSEDALRWEDIDQRNNRIHIREKVGKATRRAVGNERFVPATDTLKHWLTPVLQEEGFVIPWLHSEFSKRWRKFCAEMGIKPIPNGLRRSAISHALAGDPALAVGQVSRWAGSSEATVKKHYLELLDEQEGRDWFAMDKSLADLTLSRKSPDIVLSE